MATLRRANDQGFVDQVRGLFPNHVRNNLVYPNTVDCTGLCKLVKERIATHPTSSQRSFECSFRSAIKIAAAISVAAYATYAYAFMA